MQKKGRRMRLVQVEKELDKLSDEKLGDRFREYVKESNHQGPYNAWEGFSPRQMCGVRAFLEDFVLFITNYLEPGREKDGPA